MAWGKGTWGATGTWGGDLAYATTFDPTGLANGTWQLTIVAVDGSANHNVTTFGPIHLDVELPTPPPPPPPPPPPTPGDLVDALASFIVPYRTDSHGIAFVAPDPNDGPVAGRVTVAAIRATDDYGRPIRHAELLIDGTSIATMIPAFEGFTCELDTSLFVDGLHDWGLLTVNDAGVTGTVAQIMQLVVANGA